MLATSAAPLHAAVLTANGTNLAAVFARAKDGDTIKVVGTVKDMVLQNRSFTKAVTIDATQATFTDTLTIKNVSKVNFLGGTYGSRTQEMRTGRAVGLYNSSDVNFSRVFFVGTGRGTGVGITTAGSRGISVSAGNFQNLRLGIGITASTDVRISSSRFIGMTSDGINIADSHRVTATANRCTNGAPSAGAHPDCIQLWSILGNPRQSDISLTNNYVNGPTQGLTSFNASAGGGLRITMIGNTIATSFPQGIACGNCDNSIFTNNTLTTLPGARWRTSMNIDGNNNIIENNTVGDRPPLGAQTLALLGSLDGADISNAISLFEEPLPDFALEDLALLASMLPLDSLTPDAMTFGSTLAAVPEPTTWAQLVFGFILVGAAVRTRRSGRSVVA
ncbi:PEPxxWA-CTERM sorting domain-containing protein [Polymorphobacter fuscus]|uniref:PEPxxWA-CTERM sorting domain-containing protein n=1 Tax=Sandarakinorhabdus fusca TaxID=1439888 RepID=UPI00143100CE|nr:PEPxxWA-CTERM sorting domain-containing protein [Polymorphobacter fuscus]NJC10050.1 hypothetical protein [Polymorphobacter fuscus]